MASGIYKIQSISHLDRVYIGSAVDFFVRWEKHLSGLRNNSHRNKKLQGHYNKYGESDLVFSIVAICDKEELKPIDRVVRPEQFFIWAYNPSFNICQTAGSRLGVKASEGTRRKLSESHKGKYPSDITRHRMRIAQSERTTSPTPKGTIPWNKGKKGLQVGWNKGGKLSKETCKKISDSRKGYTPWNKGKKLPPQSEETKKKRGDAIRQTVRNKKQKAL